MNHLRTISPKLSRYTPILGLLQSNSSIARFTSLAQKPAQPPSGKVCQIADEISDLTLIEVDDLTELLKKKLGVKDMPIVSVMMSGMGFSLGGIGGGGGGFVAAEAEAEKKMEKTTFDLKLEDGFDTTSKIKIIKEVRSFTELGLKEAKALVEKTPAVIKQGVSVTPSLMIIF